MQADDHNAQDYYDRGSPNQYDDHCIVRVVNKNQWLPGYPLFLAKIQLNLSVGNYGVHFSVVLIVSREEDAKILDEVVQLSKPNMGECIAALRELAVVV